MKLVRDVVASGLNTETGDVRIDLDSSVCYDFVVSLRTMFNARTFSLWRRWSATNMPKLGAEVIAKGEFLFAGFDTALGYGVTRLISGLPAGAGPEALIASAAEADPRQLALYMLDTGETSDAQLERFCAALSGRDSVEAAVRDLEDGWAQRCRRVLRHPHVIQSDLVEVLEVHWQEVYRNYAPAIETAIADATTSARKVVDALPPLDAIEQLTGGYTFGPGAGVKSVIVAASTFILPFMSTRIDEKSGAALIIYGVRSEGFQAYEADPEPSLLSASLKALADPTRLTILRRLASSPLYTTEIRSKLDLSQTTVHHHLTQLRSVGLVKQRRERQGMQYTIQLDELQNVLRSLEEEILGAGQTEEPQDQQKER